MLKKRLFNQNAQTSNMPEEPVQPFKSYRSDRVILGDGPDCVFRTDPAETGINNNILVVGGSGSGKTVSVAEPLLLETYRKSIIATVTKRRIVDKYSRLLKSRGYDVQILDFVHPDQGTVAYDPLDFIKSPADISFLANGIVMANPRKKKSNADPYWDEAATSLLAAVISVLQQRVVEKVTFADVLEILDKLNFHETGGLISTNFDELFDKLAEKNPDNFAVSNWNSFKRLPIKTAACVYGALNTTIDSVFTPELRKMFRIRKRLNFEQLASRRTALFVISSPVNPSLNCFINMFYANAFKRLFEFGEEQPDGMLPVPVHLLADDFATGCPVPLFDQYISIFREKRISVTLLIQSESQLSSLYGEDEAITIINNCDTYLFMGTNDLSTARNISIRANIPLEDVLHMKIGGQILFRRGAKPKIGKRYNTFENENYKKVTEEYKQSLKAEKLLQRGA